MAQLLFTIADGKLKVSGGGRTEQFYATDYHAKSWRNGDADGLIIFPILGSDEPYSKGTFTFKEFTDAALNINGASYSTASVEVFVTAFNAACGSVLSFNTQYPQTIISDHIALDTSVPTQLTTIAKAGWMTISAPDGNAGVVYIGDADVDNTSYQLAAGKDHTVEIDNLSKYYAFAAVADCEISISGAYKY